MATNDDSHHVKRTRTADTSVGFTQGGVPARPGVGSVHYSRTFGHRGAAQREADAWNGAGDFAKHGPTDWVAEIVPGNAPTEKELRGARERTAADPADWYEDIRPELGGYRVIRDGVAMHWTKDGVREVAEDQEQRQA